MTSTFTRNHTAVAIACALALGVFSATANSQVRDMQGNIDARALVVDSQGAPVKNSYGECWHTATGPAPSWTTGCHAAVPAPVAQTVAPAQASAPAPAPVVMAAAAPLPVYERVAFDANVLFDSDKSALRPAGREKLDAFVSNIKGLESQSIMAIGYADRMGTDASNQVLSQQRVDTVKSYLVGQGIAANRVQTSARGETQPTTAASECKEANNASNVSCLQPDRHVFIEISGNRNVN